MKRSRAKLLACDPIRSEEFLASLSPEEALMALHAWELWARPEQLPPPGDWTTWLYMGGRGAGKTRAGAEWIRARVQSGVAKRVALVAATFIEARDVNFCDANCTLNAASYTTGYTVGSGATASFIPWSGTAPGNYALYANGSITFTSGACSGQSRTIMNGNAEGLNLAYPLYEIPAVGDDFTALQGCDKTLATCKNTYSNLQHRRAFDFVPPPDTTY